MNYFLTTQTGFSAIPLDCLQEIFQYLENDMTSLYYCMLVNRTWCRINIALLWRCPFECSGPKSTRRYSELIRTYIACLSKKAKMNIYETGYNLPSHPRPLFPYHEYLKDLDCAKLSEAVEEWIERFGLEQYCLEDHCLEDHCLKDHCPPEDPEDVVYTELLKLLLSRCKGLSSLRLGQYQGEYHLPPIASFPRIKNTLANLRRFEILGDMDCLFEADNLHYFLIKLSKISNNLEYINVDMTEDQYALSGMGLRKLISSQKNLSTFRYNQERSQVENSKEFIKALSHNASTLKNVEFNSIPLNEQCLGPLKNFNNLNYMQFVNCYEKDIYNAAEDSETEEIVEHSPSHLKVEKLMFHKGLLSSVTLEVLRLANTSVRELTVDNVVPGLFEVIVEHCPNIRYLATAISQKTFESLECLSTSEIKHLILKTLKSKDIETKDFQQLGKSLSLSLRHLSLDFNISVEELSSLLQECQSPLESLCLKFNITTDDDMNKDEYLEVVMKFAKKIDSLKEFKFSLYNQSFESIEAKDIFSTDKLSKAKQFITNIARESHQPFTCININSEASL